MGQRTPVHKARKFSAVFGTTSEKSWKGREAGGKREGRKGSASASKARLAILLHSPSEITRTRRHGTLPLRSPRAARATHLHLDSADWGSSHGHVEEDYWVWHDCACCFVGAWGLLRAWSIDGMIVIVFELVRHRWQWRPRGFSFFERAKPHPAPTVDFAVLNLI